MPKTPGNPFELCPAPHRGSDGAKKKMEGREDRAKKKKRREKTGGSPKKEIANSAQCNAIRAPSRQREQERSHPPARAAPPALRNKEKEIATLLGASDLVQPRRHAEAPPLHDGDLLADGGEEVFGGAGYSCWGWVKERREDEEKEKGERVQVQEDWI
ncbi:hypothetical protein B0H19DRAFT_1058659 [Mycena capillaripes]|nr:hypothetical protein B0H19DRAFT_1058659 [Mycena capillaripes]